MTLSRTDEIRQVASEWEFDKRIHAPRAARLLKELLRRVDELERGIGQMRLIAGLPLPPDVAAKVAEADRLRKLFDDAGEGQYNVLNLVESYQRNSMEADERLRAVRKLLEWNGCECECSHHWEDHDDDCDRCLACRIGEAVGNAAEVTRDAERTRAATAEAEVARLRAAMGRTVPPTDAEWAAIVEHDCTLIVTAEPSMTTTVATRGELDALCDAADEAGEAYVWIVVGADGWPRPWPTGGDAGR